MLDPNDPVALQWADKIIALVAGLATAFAVVYGAVRGTRQKDKAEKESNDELAGMAKNLRDGALGLEDKQALVMAKTLAAAHQGVVVVPYSEDVIKDLHLVAANIASMTKALESFVSGTQLDDGRRGIPILLSEDVKRILTDLINIMRRNSDSIEQQALDIRLLRRMQQMDDELTGKR